MDLTIDEKMELTTGDGMWHTRGLNGKLSRMHLSDGPHGLRKQEDGQTNNNSILATCFPTASAAAASWNKELISLMGASIAKEAHNEKVSVLLGPGINMKRSPLCGRNFEYYSEDPYLAGVLGTAFVKSVEELGIGTSLKHFCANSQETNRQTSNSMIDERALREIYLKAFERVVKDAKPATIMASYNRINNDYATENTHLLTEILRKEWGYEGVVVSDWGASIDLVKALKAGMNLEMPDSHGYHLKKLREAYKNGSITEEEINTAVKPLLALEAKYAVEHRSKQDNYDISMNHQNAIDIEAESAVLLENDGILPLSNRKITILGSLAKNVRFQGGGSSHIHTERVKNAITVFSEAGYQVNYADAYDDTINDPCQTLEEDALKLAKDAEIILFFGGLTDITEGEGYDRKTLSMPLNQRVFLEKLLKVNKNVIFISFGGAPYDMYFAKDVRALLHMYLGGEGVMEALEAIVSGRVNPSGHLAETFPLQIEDTPAYHNFGSYNKDLPYKESLFIGYRYYDSFNIPVRYSFGYGKSYTSFSYSDLNISEEEDRIDVSFTLKNTGSLPGKEVCQVYVSNESGEYIHAERELKGFDKIYLEANEEKQITISIAKEDMKIYDIERGWILPKGDYKIYVGASIKELHLCEAIALDGIEYKQDRNTYAVYFDIERKLKNITDSEFKALYGKEFSSLDTVKKGEYTVYNSLKDLKKHSFKARFILWLAKRVMKKSFKDKPLDDPEVMMCMEMIEMGTSDCVFCQGGIPYRILESIILSANGHRFRALHKLIWG